MPENSAAEQLLTANSQQLTAKVWQLLAEVEDPEVPVLSILDLGIVRGVKVADDGRITVTITPTYSGCPAMSAIATDIRLRLLAEGYAQVTISTQLSPAWTTDWLTAAGRRKLEEYGIAAPVPGTATGHELRLFGHETAVRCPQCQSANTRLLNQFGSTACKALYQCQDCREPFDYFKCH